MKTLTSQVTRLAHRYPWLKSILYFGYSLQHDFRYNILSFITALHWYLIDYRLFQRLKKNAHAQLSASHLLPKLTDKTKDTPLDAVYFLQDAWACGHIFSYKPKHHCDVGSFAKTIGIISQFVPTTFVDIRPIDCSLNGLTFKKGSILELPFESDSIESISSLCVIEHIGLGRYGDPIDPWGTERALSELQRVLKPGGHLLFSVPVDSENRVYFNAHRAFTRQYITSLISKRCKLTDEKYIYEKSLVNKYQPKNGFGVGLYHYIKK